MITIEQLDVMLIRSTNNSQGASIQIRDTNSFKWKRDDMDKSIKIRFFRFDIVYFGRQYSKGQTIGNC